MALRYAEAYEVSPDCWQHNLPVLLSAVSLRVPTIAGHTNIKNARDLIEAFVNGRDMDSVSVCTYSAMKRKAWDILVTAVRPGEMKAHLNGRKIVCFYENIMGEDTCTIDGHARNIAYNERVNLTDNKTNIGVKSTPIYKKHIAKLPSVALSMAAGSKHTNCRL